MNTADLVGQSGWIAAFCLLVAATTGWLAMRKNTKQAEKDSKTNYLAESVEGLHVLAEDRKQLILEREGTIAELRRDLHKMRSDIAELHRDIYKANRHAQDCEYRLDLAMRRIVELEKVKPDD